MDICAAGSCRVGLNSKPSTTARFCTAHQVMNPHQTAHPHLSVRGPMVSFRGGYDVWKGSQDVLKNVSKPAVQGGPASATPIRLSARTRLHTLIGADNIPSGYQPHVLPFSHATCTQVHRFSKAGSYLRLVDCVYHSTLGSSVVKKKKQKSTDSVGFRLQCGPPQAHQALFILRCVLEGTITRLSTSNKRS